MAGRRRQRRRSYDLVVVTPRAQPHKSKTCAATGLMSYIPRIGVVYGQCPIHVQAGVYCYYHDKVLNSLLTPETEFRYPALPLPKFGYDIEVKEIVNGE